MKAQGATTLEILKKTGLFKAKNSATWFFRNETYLGIRKCGDLQTPNAHEPLIDEETWDKVQATLVKSPTKGKRWSQEREHPSRAARPYLLSGLIRCGYCGSAMIGRAVTRGSRRGKRWRFYLCGKKNREGWAACKSGQIGAEMVESEVMGKVLDRVLDQAYLAQLLEEVNKTLVQGMDGLDFEITHAERSLEKTNRAIEALLDLAERDGSAAATGRLRMREEEKDHLEATLHRLRARLERGRVRVSEEVFADAVQRLKGNLQEGSIRERRRVLKTFVQKIEATSDKGILYYTFPLYALALDDVVYLESTPGAIRTRAHGSGGRCSIH